MFEDGHRKLGLAAPLSGIIGGCTTRCAGDPSDASAESAGGPAGSMAASGGMPEAGYEGSSQASTSSSAQPSTPAYGQVALLGDEPGVQGSLFEPELFTWANESWTVTDPGAADTVADPDRDADTAEIMGCVTAMADGLEETVRIPSQRIRFGLDSGRAPAEHRSTTEIDTPAPLVAADQATSVEENAAPTVTPAEPVIPAQQAIPAAPPPQQSDQAEAFIPASQITDPAVWGGPIVFRTPDTAGPATQPQPFSALVEPKWTPVVAWQALVRKLRSLRKPDNPSLLNKSVWLSFPPAPAWIARAKQHIRQPVRRTGRRWEPSARSVPLLAALVVLAAVSSLAVVQATSRELKSSAVEMASVGQVGADMLPGFSAPKVVKVPAPAPAVAPAPSAPAPSATPTDATHRAAPAGTSGAHASATPPTGSTAVAAAPKAKLSAPSRSHGTAAHPNASAAHSVTGHSKAHEHRSGHHSSSHSDADDRDDYDNDYSDDSDDDGLLSGLLGGGLGGLGGGLG